MVRHGMRWIYIVVCLMPLLVFSSSRPLAGEHCISVLILMDETSAEGHPEWPGYQEPEAVRQTTIQLLEVALNEALEEGSDFCIQLIKFSLDDEPDIYVLPDEPLSVMKDYRALIAQVHRNVFGALQKETILAQKKQRIHNVLCKALSKFKSYEHQSKLAFLISDMDGTLNVTDGLIDFARESICRWLGCGCWTFTTIFNEYKGINAPINTIFVPSPGKQGAPWLADIAEPTGGRAVPLNCLEGAFTTWDELIDEVAEQVRYKISKVEEGGAAGQRRITLKIQPQYEGHPIGRSETITIECENINIITNVPLVSLDNSHTKEATWDPGEKAFVASLNVSCEGDHKISVQLQGKVRGRGLERSIPLEPVPDIHVLEQHVVIADWAKERGDFMLKLNHQAACTGPEEAIVELKLDHPEHFNIEDSEGKPIPGNRVLLPPGEEQKIYFYPKADLEPDPHYRGKIALEPKGDFRITTPSGTSIAPFEYQMAVLKFDREEFKFPNLCFPPSEVHEGAFTAVLGPIRIDGLPEGWDWKRLKVSAKGFPPGIPRPEIRPVQGELFDLALTIPSCSALQPVKSRINGSDVDGYLAFEYVDPAENRLVHFKGSEIPVDLEYREKWVRILREPNSVIQGLAHKGDEWPFSLEFSPDLYPRERCVDIVFKPEQAGSTSPFELTVHPGSNLSPPSAICSKDSEASFTVRIGADSSPGYHRGIVKIQRSMDDVWLYCSSSRSEKLQESCLYRYDIDIPFIIEILNKKLSCPNIWLANAGDPKVCELELDFGEGRDAPNWGTLDLDVWVKDLSVVNNPQIPHGFKGDKETSIEFNVKSLRDFLKRAELGSYPEVREGMVKLAFSSQESDRGIVELNTDKVPIEVDVRPPVLNRVTARVQDREFPPGEVIDLGEIESRKEAVVTLKLRGGNEIFAQLPPGRREVTITCDRDGDIGHFTSNGKDCGQGINVVVNPDDKQQINLRISDPLMGDPEGKLLISLTDPDVLGEAKWSYRFTVKPMSARCNWLQGEIEGRSEVAKIDLGRVRRGRTIAKCWINKPAGINEHWTLDCDQEDFQILVNGKAYSCNDSFIGAETFVIKSGEGADVGKRTSRITIFKDNSQQPILNVALPSCFLPQWADKLQSILVLLAIIIGAGTVGWIIWFARHWYIEGESVVDLWTDSRWVVILFIGMASSSLVSLLSQAVLIAIVGAKLC